MPNLKLRPTFEIPLADGRQQVIEKLRNEYQRIAPSDLFQMFGEYGELHLPSIEHRLWSPHLSFYVAERDRVSLIHGRFAPRLEVWTLVWIIHLAMAFTAFFGLALAYSQWFVGESLWGLAVAIMAALVIVTLYIVASIGQQWSADQMASLKDRLDELLERAGVAKP